MDIINCPENREVILENFVDYFAKLNPIMFALAEECWK